MIHFTAARTAQIDADETLNKKYARILYDQKSGTITAVDTADGTTAASMNNALTYDFWKSGDVSLADFSIELDELSIVDGIGLVCDNPEGYLIKVFYWDGAAWQDWDADGWTAITDNNVIMINLTQKALTKIRVQIDTSANSVAAVIRSFYVGKMLTMQRSIYGGHSPITLNRDVKITTNYSETGQFLGRSQVRQGLSSAYDWTNLTAAWYRTNFEQFVKSAALKPFFIAWKPSSHADETAYCWTTGSISPSNTGTRDFMSVSVPVRGYSNAL